MGTFRKNRQYFCPGWSLISPSLAVLHRLLSISAAVRSSARACFCRLSLDGHVWFGGCCSKQWWPLAMVVFRSLIWITVHEALHALLGGCVCVRLCFAGWLWSSLKLYIFSRLRGCSESLQKLSAPCSAGRSHYSSSATSVRLKSVRLPPYFQKLHPKWLWQE